MCSVKVKFLQTKEFEEILHQRNDVNQDFKELQFESSHLNRQVASCHDEALAGN